MKVYLLEEMKSRLDGIELNYKVVSSPAILAGDNVYCMRTARCNTLEDLRVELGDKKVFAYTLSEFREPENGLGYLFRYAVAKSENDFENILPEAGESSWTHPGEEYL